jgi:hypothetical protein
MGTRQSIYPVSIGTHPIEKLREISRAHANGGGDKTAQHSDGWLRDLISKAVIEEKRKSLTKDHYPPISGGEHDFVATVEPTEVNGLPVTIKLIVVKDTQYGGEWAVTTVLTEETYQSRIESRAMQDAAQERNKEDREKPLAGDLDFSGLSETIGNEVMRMLVEKEILVIAVSPSGTYDHGRGFDDKEDAIRYSNELLMRGYSADKIRVFSFVKPRVAITF